MVALNPWAPGIRPFGPDLPAPAGSHCRPDVSI